MGTDRAASVGVVIPAAGKGVRLGGTRKQFRMLDNKPVLYRTVQVFDEHAAITHISIAAPEDDVSDVQRMIEAEQPATPWHVVAGGATRQESVYRAIKALPEDVHVVLVHDAVRPFVHPAMISEVIETIEKQGAAAVAVPVADTLRKGQEGTFSTTISRESVYRMQTPQGALRLYMEKAFEKALKEEWQVTDDVELLQRAGYPVHVVEGSSLNIKITTRADWEMACLIWPVWNQLQ